MYVYNSIFLDCLNHLNRSETLCPEDDAVMRNWAEW